VCVCLHVFTCPHMEPVCVSRSDVVLNILCVRYNSPSCLVLASLVGVSDESSVKHFPTSSGTNPFFPLKHETYRGHSAPITHCKFSFNASSIATADTDGVLR